MYVNVPSGFTTAVPFAGGESKLNVNGSPAGSEASTCPEIGMLMLVVRLTSVVTGGTFVTVMMTGAVSVPPRLSVASTVNESEPTYPAFGVYVNVPSGFSATVPLTGGLSREKVIGTPSGSVAVTAPLTGVF